MSLDLNKVAKTVLADALQLDNPAVVTTVVGFVVAETGAFGLHPSTTAVAAVLAGVGAIATAINKALGAFSLSVTKKSAAPAPPAPTPPVV